MKLINVFVVICIYASLSFGADTFSSKIQITNAKVRATPPVSKVSAGFMNIKSTHMSDIKLVGVKSNFSKTSEIHGVEFKDSFMRMYKLEYLKIPSKQVVELKKGSYHLMFIDLLHPLKIGDKKEVTLFFDDGSNKTIFLPVKR